MVWDFYEEVRLEMIFSMKETLRLAQIVVHALSYGHDLLVLRISWISFVQHALIEDLVVEFFEISFWEVRAFR